MKEPTQKANQSNAVVVTQDRAHRIAICNVLTTAGLEPEGFNSAEEALDRRLTLAHADPIPSIIVTDLVMPGIDGWQFCRLLRSREFAHLNSIPVIVLSRATLQRASMDAAGIGADVCLEYPLDEEALKCAAISLIGRKPDTKARRALFVSSLAGVTPGLELEFEKCGWQIARLELGDTVRHEAGEVIIVDSEQDLVSVRAQYPGTEVVVASDIPSEAALISCYQSGAAYVLSKPYSPGELVDVCLRVAESQTLSAAVKDIESQALALQAREERQAVVLGSAMDGYFLVDGTGRLLAANDTYSKMTGYAIHELLGMHIADLDVNESPEDVAVRVATVLAQGHARFEARHRRKDGTVIEVEISATREPGELGYVASFIRDVSDQKRTEAVMAARYRLLERASSLTVNDLLQATLDEAEELTGSKVGFYHFVDSDQESISLQTWSSRTIAGVCTAEGTARHYKVKDAGVWVDCIKQRKAVIHNDYPSLSHRKGLPPGHAPITRELLVPVFRDDKIVAVLGVGDKPENYDERDTVAVASLADLAWDIVERLRAEDALRQSESNLKEAQEIARIGRWELDIVANHLSWSDGIYFLFEVAPESFAASYEAFLSFVHPDDREMIDAQYKLSINEHMLFSMEHRLLMPDGRIKWVHEICKTQYDDAGKPIRSVGTVQDISERKLAEEGFRQSESILRESQAIAKLGSYVLNVQSGKWTSSSELNAIFGIDNSFDRSVLGWHRIIHPDDVNEMSDYLSYHVLEMGEPFDREYRIVRQDSCEVRWVHGLGRLERDADGMPVSMIGTIQDITDRKIVEQALRESEEKHRRLFETMAQGVVYQRADGYIISANPAAERILGLTASQMRAMTSKDSAWNSLNEDGSELDGDDHPSMIALRTRQPVGPATIGVYNPQDGWHHWLSVSAVPLFSSGSELPFQVYTTFTDITESKKANDELVAERHFSDSLLRSLPGIFYLYTFPELKLVRWNENHATLLGYETDEMLGKSVFDWHVAEAKDAVAKAINDVMELGVNTIEAPLITKDGRAIPFLLTGAKLVLQDRCYLMGVGVDISDRTRALRALEKTSARLQSIIDNSSAAYFLIDANGIFRAVNSAWLEMHKYSSEDEVLGRHFEITQVEEQSENARQVVATMMAKRETLQGEFSRRCKDGTIGWHTFSISPVWDEDDVVGIEGFLIDITARKCAEEALALESMRRKLLFDQSPDGIVILDPASARIVEFNTAAHTQLGYSREEFGRLTVFELEVLETSSDTRGRIDTVLQGGKSDFETLQRAKDGSIRNVHVSAQIVDVLGQPIYQCIWRDITERKAAESALRDANLLLEQTFEQSPVPMVLVSMPGAVLRYVNPACYRFLGIVDEKSVVGKSLSELVPSWQDYDSDDLLTPFEQLPLAKALKGIYTEGEERYIVRKDGSFRYELVSAAPIIGEEDDIIAGYLVMMDITDLKRAEYETAAALEALSSNEARLSLALEVGNAGVWSWDLLSNELDFDSRFHQFLGYEVGELPHDMASWVLYQHPDDVDAMFKRIDAYVSGVTPIYESEHRIRAKSGEWCWIYTRGKYVARKATGAFDLFLGIAIDVTERKKVEEENAFLEVQLQQAQKMESVGRLAGGVAHDFNNMLGVILGHAELALEQVQAEEPIVSDLVEIRKAAERSAELTRQLLAFARKQAVAPKALDLNDTVESMLRMLQRLVGENVKVTWTPGEGLWPVKVDPTQVDQILANLCVNARDAIEGYGNVYISTSNAVLRVEDESLASSVSQSDYVSLVVSDDGCGMDRETLDHLFEPFFTTKSVGKGTGLGLATVYGIVKQNGGRIEAESEVGRGTTITICFPRERSIPERPNRAAEKEGSVGGHEEILIVEDEPSVRAWVARVVSDLGYRVTVAGNGAEALELVRSQALSPDLVLTDVVMPGMSGPTMIDALVQTNQSLKVLYMSGYSDNVELVLGESRTGHSFIQKPFTADALAVMIRQVIDRGVTVENVPLVVMIDDDEQYADLVRRICSSNELGFVAVETISELLETLSNVTANVLLIDLHMPGTDGNHVLKSVRAAGHSVPAILLSGSLMSVDLDASKESGFELAIEKTASGKDLIRAIKDAMHL